MENLLRKHSKALYMAFGIMLFAVLIAALFYATNYANIRIFYTIGNGGTILISDVTENAEIAGETNQTLFAYFNNFSQGINMDTFKMTIFNFQHDLSNFNTLSVWFAIVGIIAFAALLILGNHNRNIYYKSNLIGGIILPIIVAAFAVVMLIQNIGLMNRFVANQSEFNIVSAIMNSETSIEASKITDLNPDVSNKALEFVRSQNSCNSITFIIFEVLFGLVLCYSLFLIFVAVKKYKITEERRNEVIERAVKQND